MAETEVTVETHAEAGHAAEGHAAGHGAHHAPTGFIRKYIFSIDHKVIGIQYLLLALFSVVLGMLMSVLMRMKMTWPDHALAHPRHALPGGRARGRDDAGVLPLARHHARDDDGLLRADDGAAGRLRQLLPAHPDRRRRHGVPLLEHAVVLGHVHGARRARGRHLRLGRLGHRADGGLDGLRAALGHRAPAQRAGAGDGRQPLGHQHRHLLRRLAARRAELHRHAFEPAHEGHVPDEDAADVLGVVHDRRAGAALVPGAAGGGRAALPRPQRGHELLRPRRPLERDGRARPLGRLADSVAAPLLVLRAPGGLHRHPAGHGRHLAHPLDVRAQAHLRLPRDGLRDVRHRAPRLLRLGPPHVHSAACRR